MDRDGYSGLERGEELCASCGKRLAEEPASFAALSPEADGFRRRDYCTACFATLPGKPFSFWKRAPSAKRGEGKSASKEEKKAARRRDLDALLELFERLEKETREGAEKLRYLLALALVRKKRLHLVELARAGGADCLVLRASGEADLVTVPAPQLSKDDLERLAKELEEEVGLS